MKPRTTSRFVAILAALVLAFTLAGPASPAAAEIGYYKYPWSSAIYHTYGTNSAALSYKEWVERGAPTPKTVYRIVGDKTIRNVSSPDELFVVPPLGGLPHPNHHLTPAEWNQRGGAIVSSPYRYWKYANSAVIYRSASGYQQPLSYDSWVWEGSPTPDVV
ncbi:hypothetical protein RDI86_02055 [Cellulosimicrobium sp. XJ-DQ-B-000]|uniref:hypothetical protein n=1 Tax=Cellulosimicrobium sp. XJ-DQ-B-000 TaxID=3072182 RepID=UPI002809C7BD|nr:hypothetical protein [Cellulosimicrobium sp. XJ-DQ-B-000]MDQ8040631.1 hypothetical protein [Cellulosimicrobium sp. XJ-DQ-B-000]